MIHNYPAVKLLCGIAGGIMLGMVLNFRNVSHEVLPFALSVCALFALLFIVLLEPRLPATPFAVRNVVQSAAYWFGAICCGLLIHSAAEEVRVETPHRLTSIVVTMPATVRGTVQRVVRKSPTSAHCVVHGVFDAQAFPRLQNCTVLLTLINSEKDTASQHYHTSAMFLESLQAGTHLYAVVQAHAPHSPVVPTDRNEAAYAASLGVSWFVVANVDAVAQIHANARSFAWSDVVPWLRAIFDRAADYLGERVDRLFPEETAALAFALLTGSTSCLDATTLQDYRRAGTIHVLAASGLHVALIALIAAVPLAWIRQKWLRYAALLLVLFVFVLLTGNQPSALRAVILTACVLLAQVLERRTNILNAVAFGAVLLLAFEPVLLYSLGFQLSLGAVIGIVLCATAFEQGCLRLFGVPQHRVGTAHVRRILAQSLAVTLAAGVVASPLVAFAFGQYSVVSPLANLAVVPLSSAAMVYALASVCASFVWQTGAEWLAWVAHVLLQMMNALNHAAATLPFAVVPQRFAVGIALETSLASVYVLCAGSARLLLFRLLFVCVGSGAMSSFVMNDTPPHTAPMLIPREQVVACVVREKHCAVVLLQDRRLAQSPHADVGLERFIEEYVWTEKQDSLYIWTTGPASMLIASQLAPTDTTRQGFMRVLATSLLYKSPRWFQALDTLRARHVAVVNAHDYLLRDSNLALVKHNDGNGNGKQLLWNPWKTTISGLGSQNATIQMPDVVSDE
jgi:ComEC/Rec2-related protein